MINRLAHALSSSENRAQTKHRKTTPVPTAGASPGRAQSAHLPRSRSPALQTSSRPRLSGPMVHNRTALLAATHHLLPTPRPLSRGDCGNGGHARATSCTQEDAACPAEGVRVFDGRRRGTGQRAPRACSCREGPGHAAPGPRSGSPVQFCEADSTREGAQDGRTIDAAENAGIPDDQTRDRTPPEVGAGGRALSRSICPPDDACEGRAREQAHREDVSAGRASIQRVPHSKSKGEAHAHGSPGQDGQDQAELRDG